ncbi:nuclease-related domain-containing protein, partial [Acinetobacter baumannii]
LDIAPWNGNKQTEIDFLIIIPDRGLLCVEVKGHSRIEYVSGMWHLGREPPDRRGPFVQANEALFALLKRLKNDLPQLWDIPVQRCVI